MSPGPQPPVDDRIWRNRFIFINLVRIGRTILVLVGLLVWQGNLLRAGGWPTVGIPMAMLGLLISFGGPKYLASQWRTGRGE